MDKNDQLFELLLAILKENLRTLEDVKNSLAEDKRGRVEHSLSRIRNYTEQFEDILSPGSRFKPTQL